MSDFKKGLFVGIVIMSSIFLFIASTQSVGTIKEYYLIRGEGVEDFNVSMNKYISLGWEPYGSPFTHNSHWFYQTIVKYKIRKAP